MNTRPKKRSAKDRSSPSTRATAPVKGIFAELAPELRRALAAVGYSLPTAIQAQAIPRLLAGRDLFGCA